MLADSRSRSLVSNFAGQWLHLRNLESITPDLRLFPDFDDNLRQAFRQETELFFESVLREDRSVLDLLKADYTFLNERLAKHYGIPNVYGSRFRRVALDKDSERGGLLRHGSILTVTSYATRTSPVIRGKWILENILGTPPPPPLPNVPALKDNTVSATLSVRERLAEHRANAACASCHNLMDPVGFSLENFDAVGRWRTAEEGKPVDASGGLPDGSKFTGVPGSRQALLKRPELFVGTLTEKLLTFALGPRRRTLRRPAVRKIVREAQGDGLPLLVDHCRNRQQHTVHNEEIAHDHHEESSAAADVPARHGRHAGAAVAGRDGSRRDGAGEDAGRTRCAGSASFSCRWAATSRAGLRPATRRSIELSPILSSLAPVKEHVTAITNLELQNAYPGSHATSNSAFLSAAKAKLTESTDYYLGTTVDQIAAQQIGQETQLPSLELAMDLLQVVGQCDNGYACVYQNNLSWSSPTTPLPAEAHPRIVFESLFGEGGSIGERRAALRKRASLLDSFNDDIARLQRKLGPGDRARVSQYLETVREVERRIQKAEADTADNPLPDLDRPVGVPAAYADHARLMFDLAGAGAAGRCHARHHVPARARNQQSHLSRDRRSRSASSALASRQRSGKDRAHGEDQSVPCVAVRRVPREIEGHAGRERHAARPFALSLRQRHRQSQHP